MSVKPSREGPDGVGPGRRQRGARESVGASCGVDLTPTAARELERLPKRIRRRIARWFDALAEDPRCKGSKKLEGAKDLYRVYAGRDDVIVYAIVGDAVLVRVAHQREAYRRL